MDPQTSILHSGAPHLRQDPLGPLPSLHTESLGLGSCCAEGSAKVAADQTAHWEPTLDQPTPGPEGIKG